MMEFGEKLKDLNMTVDEMDRLRKAFRDEKFREMLRDYARELSDPEKQKRYEEEIKILEQDRGNTVEFIHPEPFKSFRTSVNGKQKCFVNICGNDKVAKPTCTSEASKGGHRGQRWSLPHSLHPGRQDTDAKGRKIVIYDIIFHPDTLYMASRNSRFMEMVENTAFEGIQRGFKVTLDKNNIRVLNTKYKGTPQPCIIRKPISGYKAKEPSDKSDPLAFLYPDDKRPTASLQPKATESAATEISGGADLQIQPLKSKEPTRPNYVVKYRSYMDIQDFRCSRDSARDPRPKEIVVTIDVPLLKAVTDVSLEVEDRTLVLESEKPAYRLQLPLAYPVDEDKGEAKYNKGKGQLIVTLPVLPSNEASDFAAGPIETSEAGAEDELKEEEGKGPRDAEEDDLRQQKRAGKDGEEENQGQEKGEEQMREGENSKDEEIISVEEDLKWKICEENVEEEEKLKEQMQRNYRRNAEDSAAAGFQCTTVDPCVVSEEETSRVAAPETGRQPVLFATEPTCCAEKKEAGYLNSFWETTPKTETSDAKEETEKSAAGSQVR